MEIKGHSPNVLRIEGGQAYVAHTVLVDFVYRHIEADVIRGSIFDVFHNSVVSITANVVVALSVTVKAEKYQISLGKINGIRAVRYHVDYEKAYFLPSRLEQRRLSSFYILPAPRRVEFVQFVVLFLVS